MTPEHGGTLSPVSAFDSGDRVVVRQLAFRKRSARAYRPSRRPV